MSHRATGVAMRSNLRMQALLERLNLHVSELLLNREDTGQPRLQRVDGCVFLEEEYRHCPGVALAKFPDRTGIECFVNHLHFRVGRGRRALERVFRYTAALSESLRSLRDGNFQILLSVANGDCTVRFHKCRPGEEWLTNDLEGYKREAILVLTVHALGSM
jgi:hypothetical protein